MCATRCAPLCSGRASDVGDELAPRLQGIWERYDGLVAAEPAFYVGRMRPATACTMARPWSFAKCGTRCRRSFPTRIFLGTNEVVRYTPKKPGDEKFAEQATDANHVLWTQNEGEQLLLDTLVLAAQVRRAEGLLAERGGGDQARL